MKSICLFARTKRCFGAKATDLAVMPGSPADKAGFLENDIILEVNGQKIDDQLPLDQAFSRLSAGDQVKFKILRKGENVTITAALGEKK